MTKPLLLPRSNLNLNAVRLRLLCGRVGSFASTELVPDTSKGQSSDSNSGRRQTSNWNHLDGLA